MNKLRKSIIGVLLTALSNAQAFLPSGYQQMEIEAKWQTDLSTYENIITDFNTSSTWEGENVNIRWNGTVRRYVDVYYDSNSILSDDLHSIRWRKRARVRTTNVLPLVNGSAQSWVTLQNANWSEDWQKVQYKSTPYRYGDVWFRTESGDCEVGSECGCFTASSILSGACAHNATTALKAEHGNDFFTNNTLGEFLQIVDYRFRVELGNSYEISVDRLKEYTWNGSAWVEANGGQEYYEVELELTSTPTASSVNKLFNLMHALRTQYNLRPSIYSKAGVPADAFGLVGNRNTSTWYGTISDAVNAASNMDTIIAEPATYYENVDFGNKGLTLASRYIEEPLSSFTAETILDGINNNGPCITIRNANMNTSHITGLKIQNGKGKYRYSNYYGGAIYLIKSDCVINNVWFDANRATVGAAIYTNKLEGSGIVPQSDATIEMYDCLFTHHTSAPLRIYRANDMIIEDVNIFDNGGIATIYNSNDVIIDNCNFSKNTFGMYLGWSDIEINNTRITNNGHNTTYSLGAAYVYSGSVTFSKCVITDNRLYSTNPNINGKGGGIWANGSAKIYLKENTLLMDNQPLNAYLRGNSVEFSVCRDSWMDLDALDFEGDPMISIGEPCD